MLSQVIASSYLNAIFMFVVLYQCYEATANIYWNLKNWTLILRIFKTEIILLILVIQALKLVTQFHSDFLLSLFFDPEDGGDVSV
jgi:hypothetical protein